jgi:hypothetical protein
MTSFGHAAITEMIILQFTTITHRIRNKIRNGNWFPKFSINRKEQIFLPICLRLLTLLTIIKDPSLRGLRGGKITSVLFHLIYLGFDGGYQRCS